MESSSKKKMVVVVILVLVAAAAFTLMPSAVAFAEKDVIGGQAIEAVLQKRGVSRVEDDPMVSALVRGKTIISNPVLEEALLKIPSHGADNWLVSCGESCVWLPCGVSVLFGCKCNNKVCYKNALPNSIHNYT